MMAEHFGLPGGGVDVGVNLCCENAFVTEHLLHYTEVSPVFD